MFTEALGIHQELGDDSWGTARSLLQLGRVQLLARDYQGAEKLFRESFAAWEDAGDELGMADALAQVGHCLKEGNRLPEAREVFERSLELGFESASPLFLANLESEIANTHLLTGDRALAIQTFLEARDRLAEVEGELAEAARSEIQAVVHQLQDEHALAVGCFDISIDLHTRSGRLVDAANRIIGKSRSLRSLGDSAGERNCLLAAEAILEPMGSLRLPEVRERREELDRLLEKVERGVGTERTTRS